MGDVTPPDKYAAPENRRQFMALGLGWLVFWQRGHKKLGGVDFDIRHSLGSGRRFLLIHGNEATARQVLTTHVRSAHGTAYLVRNTNRNVDFKGGVLDPNRMFSREGADRNLRTLNAGWSEAQIVSALLVLDRKRHEIVDAVRPRNGDVLIAVHNNSSGYSVRDEVGISDRVAMNDEPNPHEFCLCTNERDFDLLSKGKYNVVLQRQAPKTDDGSLSRLSVVDGFRYVNIEAGLGRVEKQTAMLNWVDATLPSKQG